LLFLDNFLTTFINNTNKFFTEFIVFIKITGNIMKKIIFILSIIFTGISHSASPSLSTSNTSPIKIAPSGHLVVDVTINGLYTHPFIIDTGANSVTIPVALYRQLNIPSNKITIKQEIGANGTYDVQSFNLDSTAVGESIVKNLEASVANEPIVIPGFDGIEMGVLPNIFLKQFLTQIDQKSKTVSFHPLDTTPSELYPQIEFDETAMTIKPGGMIDFSINVNETSLTSHFDTGAGNSLLVNWLAAKKLGLSKASEHISVLGQAMGTDGNVFDLYGMKEQTWVNISGSRFKTRLLIADMSVFEVMGGGARGNLGVGLFKERKLFINYKSKRLYFTKS